MSSRDTPPPRSSMYKMNKAANMRIQESRRRTSATLQGMNAKMSQQRVSRVSMISSRQSVGSSRRSIASANKRRLREDSRALRDTVSTGRRSRGKRKKKRRTSQTPEARAEEPYRAAEVIPALSESNNEFMSSNYTYSTVLDQEMGQLEVTAAGIFNQPQENPTANLEEGGWRIVNYIRSVKNSIFKEAENAHKTEKPDSSAAEQSPDSSPVTPLTRTPKSAQLVRNPSPPKMSSSSLARRDAKPKEVQRKGGALNAQAGRVNSSLQRSSKIIQASVRTEEKNIGQQRIKEPSSQDLLPKKKGRLQTNAHVMRLSNVAMRPGLSHNKGASVSEMSIPSPVPSSQRIPKSALKSSRSQMSMASTSSQRSGSSEKKMKRVSILATMGSLDNMANAINQLEREKKLEAMRRLESVAMEKRKQLADTRLRLRESLEEEIKINKQLEGILAKIRMVRKAGEEASSIVDKQTQVFATKKTS